MVVHAPRVAAPSFRRGGRRRSARRRRDGDPRPGPFPAGQLRRLELGASPETAKLFNAFKIRVSDVSASVASGRWDPRAPGPWKPSTTSRPVYPPSARAPPRLQALAPVSGRAGLEVTFDADAVRVALSPRASRSSCPSSPMSQRRLRRRRVGWRRGTTGAPDDDSLIEEEDPEELIGWTMCQILVVSFGRLRWSSCAARVREDAGVPSLEFYGVGPAQSRRVAAPLPLAGGGALRVSRETRGVAEHAMGRAGSTAARWTPRRSRRNGEDAARTRTPPVVSADSSRGPRRRAAWCLVGLDSDELAERFRERVNSAARASARSAVPLGGRRGRFRRAPRRRVSSRRARSRSRVSRRAQRGGRRRRGRRGRAKRRRRRRPRRLAGRHVSGPSPDPPARWPCRLRGTPTRDAWWLAAFDPTSECVLARTTLRACACARQSAEETTATLELAAFDVFDERARWIRREGRVAHAASASGRRRDEKRQRGVDTEGGGGGGGDVFVASYRAVPTSSPRYSGVDVDLDLAVGALCFSARRSQCAALATMSSSLAAVRCPDGKEERERKPVVGTKPSADPDASRHVTRTVSEARATITRRSRLGSRARRRASRRAWTGSRRASARRRRRRRRIRNRGFPEVRRGRASGVSARGAGAVPLHDAFPGVDGESARRRPAPPRGAPMPRRRARGGGGARGARQSREKNVSLTRRGRRSTKARRRTAPTPRRSRACPPCASCTWRALSRSARRSRRTAQRRRGGGISREKTEALSGDASDASARERRVFKKSARQTRSALGVRGVRASVRRANARRRVRAGGCGARRARARPAAGHARLLAVRGDTHGRARGEERVRKRKQSGRRSAAIGVDVALAPRADAAEHPRGRAGWRATPSPRRRPSPGASSASRRRRASIER